MISTTYKRNEQKNQTRKENGKKYSNMPIVEVWILEVKMVFSWFVLSFVILNF